MAAAAEAAEITAADRRRLVQRSSHASSRAIESAATAPSTVIRTSLIPQVPRAAARAMPTATRAQYHPAGAAAAGAGLCQRNQGLNHPGAAGAAAGAGYANTTRA